MTRLIDADALLEAVKDSAEINVGVITALVTHVSLSDVMETITNAPTVQQGEPFGYFKAEPFGWTDCAETDEGAIVLYEAPTIQREGWVSVPIEPTETMLYMGEDVLVNDLYFGKDARELIEIAYKAMISAAPTLKEKG